MKFIRIAAWAAAGLACVIGVAVAWLAFSFDPNDYKADLVALVEARTQRTLRLDGDLKLFLWPQLGVDLGQATLSERRSKAPFVAVEQARVSVGIWPLLRGRMVVDELTLAGASVNLSRDKSGRLNIDDLMKPSEQGESERVDFDIASVKLKHAALTFNDGMSGNTLQLSKLDLTTGRLRDGVRTSIDLRTDVHSVLPAAAATVELKTDMMFEQAAQRVALHKLKAKVGGTVLDIRETELNLAGDIVLAWGRFALEVTDLTASAAGVLGPRRFEAKLAAPRIALTGDQLEGAAATVSARVIEAHRTVTADLKMPAFSREGRRFRTGAVELLVDLTQTSGAGKVAGKDAGKDAVKMTLSAPLSGQLTADGQRLQSLGSSLLAAKANGTLQGRNLDLQLASPLDIDIAARKFAMPALKVVVKGSGDGLPGGKLAADLVGALKAALSNEQLVLDLKGKVDASQLTAHVELTGLEAPRFRFETSIDTLNIDQYRQADASTTGDKGKRSGDNAAGKLDFSALRSLRGEGKVRVDRLVVDGLTLAAVQADLRAAGGKLDVTPFSAAAFGGTVRGALTLDGAGPTPGIALKTQASGIAIAPLLKHFAQSDTLEGRGSLNLDITTRGASTDAMRAGLNGSGDIVLVDGAIRGFNLAGTLREARGMLQQLRGEKTYRGNAVEKTDFSELKGTFTIRDGVLSNRDLALKAPLLRATGAGSVNLAQGTLDYTTRATLAATSKGQGGKDVGEVRGFTVPVRFTGPLSAPQYTIDFAGMAMEAARGEVESRVREALEKKLGGGASASQKDAPKNPSSKPADTLREGLRGLFGR